MARTNCPPSFMWPATVRLVIRACRSEVQPWRRRRSRARHLGDRVQIARVFDQRPIADADVGANAQQLPLPEARKCTQNRGIYWGGMDFRWKVRLEFIGAVTAPQGHAQ